MRRGVRRGTSKEERKDLTGAAETATAVDAGKSHPQKEGRWEEVEEAAATTVSGSNSKRTVLTGQMRRVGRGE